MAPQPLSKVCSNAKIQYGAVLAARLFHAWLIIDAINLGSSIDFVWARILAQLLGATPNHGMAMYQALVGGEGRRTALLAAARSSLDKDDLLLFQAIVAASRRARSIRNDFVHHVWAVSKEVPDGLLLINPASNSKFALDFARWKLAYSKSGKPSGKQISPDRTNIFVWRQKDLEEAKNILDNTHEMLLQLVLGLFSDAKSGKVYILSDTAKKLASLPMVTTALKKLSPPLVRPSRTARKRPNSL